MPLAWLSTDGKKLLATRMLRTFAYGYLSVALVGGITVIYDLLVYAAFRNVRPPEESD